MSDVAKSVLEWCSANGRAFLETWYLIMTKRHGAFQELHLDSEDVFMFSLKFLAFIAVVGVIIDIPVASLAGFKYESNYYILSSFAVLFVLWMVYATILHACMKLFRGKATYRETIALFCFLTAFFPPIMLLQLPFARFVQPIIKNPEEIQTIMSESNVISSYAAVISAVLSTIFFVWFIIVLFKSANLVHGLSGWRAFSACTVFVVSLFVFILLIGIPFQSLILEAFA